MSFHNPKSASEIDRNLPRLQPVATEPRDRYARMEDPYGKVKPANQKPVDTTEPFQD